MEEKSAAQKEAIKKMVDELNESVPGLALAYDKMGDSINMDADATERYKRTNHRAENQRNDLPDCEINGKMNELQEEYEKSCEKARENIETQLSLFNELDGTAKTSIGNLIGTLKGQAEYMKPMQKIFCGLWKWA